MAANGLHISISAEKVFSVGGFEVSNSILTSLIVSGLLILFAFAVKASLKNSNRPSGLQNFAEFLVESLFELVEGITGSRQKAVRFFPIIATFFLFILTNNWFGLLPGVGSIGFIEHETGTQHAQLLPSSATVTTPVAQAATTESHAPQAVHETETHAVEATHAEPAHTESGAAATEHAPEAEGHGEGGTFVPYLRAGTADLNTTLALAIISVVMAQVFGLHHLSLSYLKKFFNFSSPILFFVGILELVSEFGKILSFAFRLFGNIFAGEVLLAVVTGLAYVVVPMPFYGLEIFVGFIQALVFALLSTVFFNMATISHDEH